MTKFWDCWGKILATTRTRHRLACSIHNEAKKSSSERKQFRIDNAKRERATAARYPIPAREQAATINKLDQNAGLKSRGQFGMKERTGRSARA